MLCLPLELCDAADAELPVPGLLKEWCFGDDVDHWPHARGGRGRRWSQWQSTSGLPALHKGRACARLVLHSVQRSAKTHPGPATAGGGSHYWGTWSSGRCQSSIGAGRVALRWSEGAAASPLWSASPGLLLQLVVYWYFIDTQRIKAGWTTDVSSGYYPTCHVSFHALRY